MRLVEGKFYDDSGKIVPVEFGNKQQIDLINKAQKRIDELHKGMELEVDVQYSFSASWSCVCGTHMNWDDVSYESEKSDLLPQNESCRKCQREYKIYTDSNDDVFVKLIEK